MARKRKRSRAEKPAPAAVASAVAAPASALPADDGRRELFMRRLAHTAWLSVLLGMLLELLALGIAALASKLPASFVVLAEFAGKISWALIVCAGITCGLAFNQSRPGLMAAFGALAGPIAFRTAFALQKGVVRTLNESAPAGPSASVLLAIAIFRGVEYGCFGLLLGWISQRPQSTLRTYLACGLVIGVVFEGLFLVLSRILETYPQSVSGLVTLLANGVMFPIGCAFVLFTTQVLARRNA